MNVLVFACVRASEHECVHACTWDRGFLTVEAVSRTGVARFKKPQGFRQERCSVIT